MSGILDLFKQYATEALVGYFLILWGISHLLDVVWGLYHLDGFTFSTLLDLLWALTDFFSGLILIVLGSRIRQESS